MAFIQVFNISSRYSYACNHCWIFDENKIIDYLLSTWLTKLDLHSWPLNWTVFCKKRISYIFLPQKGLEAIETLEIRFFLNLNWTSPFCKRLSKYKIISHRCIYESIVQFQSYWGLYNSVRIFYHIKSNFSVHIVDILGSPTKFYSLWSTRQIYLSTLDKENGRLHTNPGSSVIFSQQTTTIMWKMSSSNSFVWHFPFVIYLFDCGNIFQALSWSKVNVSPCIIRYLVVHQYDTLLKIIIKFPKLYVNSNGSVFLYFIVWRRRFGKSPT